MATKEKWITVNGRHMKVEANSSSGKHSDKPSGFDMLNNSKTKKSASSNKKGKK